MRQAKTVLICGSRTATQGLHEIAVVALKKNWWAGNRLIVGDALGIDKTVVQTAEIMGAQYQCYGLAHSARNGAQCYQRLTTLVNRSHAPKQQYRQRDEFMVEPADLVICLWNGYSPGTRQVAEYAKLLGKQVYLRTLEETLYASL